MIRTNVTRWLAGLSALACAAASPALAQKGLDEPFRDLSRAVAWAWRVIVRADPLRFGDLPGKRRRPDVSSRIPPRGGTLQQQHVPPL